MSERPQVVVTTPFRSTRYDATSFIMGVHRFDRCADQQRTTENATADSQQLDINVGGRGTGD